MSWRDVSRTLVLVPTARGGGWVRSHAAGKCLCHAVNRWHFKSRSERVPVDGFSFARYFGERLVNVSASASPLGDDGFLFYLHLSICIGIAFREYNRA